MGLCELIFALLVVIVAALPVFALCVMQVSGSQDPHREQTAKFNMILALSLIGALSYVVARLAHACASLLLRRKLD